MTHLWGESTVIHQSARLIVVQAASTGGYGMSSVHYHSTHENGIVVLKGAVVLKEVSGGCFRRHYLQQGESKLFLPKVSHQLVFAEPCAFLEWYVSVDSEDARLGDIVRQEEGRVPEHVESAV